MYWHSYTASNIICQNDACKLRREEKRQLPKMVLFSHPMTVRPIISLCLFSPSHSTSLSAVSREKVYLPVKSRHQGGCCFDIKRPSSTKLSTPAMWFRDRERRKTMPADKPLQHKKSVAVWKCKYCGLCYSWWKVSQGEKLNTYHAVKGKFQCHCNDATSVRLRVL